MVKRISKKTNQGSKRKESSQYGDAERRRGRRFLFVWLPIILVALGLFNVLVFDPPKPIGQPLPGISRDAEKTRSGEEMGKTYTVILDDGRIVKPDGLPMGSLEPGRRVLIQEKRTRIFKRKTFSFIRYLEEKH